MANLYNLPISTLFHSPTNPRKSYPDEQTIELAESIKRHGLINPITVRPMNVFTQKAFESGDIEEAIRFSLQYVEFEVVAGNRRFKAAQYAGLPEVPAMLSDLSDDEVLDIQIDENLHRQDVPPLEEAEGFRFLLDSRRLTVAELANRIGKSESYVYRRLNLVNLHECYHDLVRTGVMPVTQAEIVASYPHEAQVEAKPFLLVRDYEDKTIAFESVQYTRRKMGNYTYNLDRAPWVNDRAYEGFPACTACEKNTAVASLLFPETGKKALCTDRVCYNQKMKAAAVQHVNDFNTVYKGKDYAFIHAAYGYNLDDGVKNSITPLLSGKRILDSSEYTIVDADTPNAVPALYVSVTSWDKDQLGLLYTQTWIMPKGAVMHTESDVEDQEHHSSTKYDALFAGKDNTAEILEKFQFAVLNAIPTATPSIEMLLLYFCHLRPLGLIMQLFPEAINAPEHEIFRRFNKDAGPDFWGHSLDLQAKIKDETIRQLDYIVVRTHIAIYGILNSTKEEKESALWVLYSQRIGNMLNYMHLDIREVLFPFAQANGVNPVDHDPTLLINLM